jgi:hypothetical protein
MRERRVAQKIFVVKPNGNGEDNIETYLKYCGWRGRPGLD